MIASGFFRVNFKKLSVHNTDIRNNKPIAAYLLPLAQTGDSPREQVTCAFTALRCVLKKENALCHPYMDIWYSLTENTNIY